MKTVHMIGNAHLDPVWLWNWQEGYQENKATFYSALERMKEFDDVIFTSSSAQFYEWIEENDPEMFTKIKQRVHEGRWKICGGWWVQPDTNLPSGESFARHALLAQNYFMEKFNIRVTTGYCVDSFGHNAMLPQILRKSGMSRYVYMRPNEFEKQDIPFHSFLWEAPDGSRVSVFRIIGRYCNWDNLETVVPELAGRIQDGMEDIMCFYGVGNHGGGPTVENIRAIHKLQKSLKETQVIFSDPDTFFDTTQENELPIIRGELQYHSPGCYSAVSMIKQKNRETENALLAAEKFAVLSKELGVSAKDFGLTRAWKALLFNQFHDTLAGSAIESAYKEARNQIGEALSIAHRCTTDALNKISFHINIPYSPRKLPVVVFNPNAFIVCAPVEVENGMFGNGISMDNCCIINNEGNVISHQEIAPSCRVTGRRRMTFQAEVPALGYRLFFVDDLPQENQLNFIEEMKEPQTPYVLENEYLRVSFSKKTGMIESCYDKKAKREVLEETSSVSVIDDSMSDTWGHQLKKLDAVNGRFMLTSARVLDFGPVRKAVQFISKYKNSTIVQVFLLYTHEDKLRVKVRVDWHEKQAALKFYFTPALSERSTAVVETAFGHVEKKRFGREEVMQRWADVSDETYGLALINDGKYAVDFTDNRIGLTVLRSPVYAHHKPYVLQEDEMEEYHFIDQGISEFAYMLKPHSGDWRSANIVREAEVFNQPMEVMFETFHHGKLPGSFSAIEACSENIIISSVKKAFRGEGIIIRLYETFGRAGSADIMIFGRKYLVEFVPYEVKTLLLQDGELKETDFLELPC